jgi:histidinol-phosphate aminotransferase
MLIGNPALTGEVNKVRLPYNVNALSQATARAVLAHGDLVRENAAAIVAERGRVLGALAGMPGVRAYDSDANFFLLRTERPAEEVARAILARAIVVRDFSQTPGLAGCLRVTVGTPAENTAFLTALGEVLGRGSDA